MIRIFTFINPYLTNGFSHHYQLGGSTFIFRGIRSELYFLSHLTMKFLCANRIAPDGTPQNVTSGAMLFACQTKRTPGLNELKIFNIQFYLGSPFILHWQV